jgi:bifunctional non-homologous end joining protein LigD
MLTFPLPTGVIPAELPQRVPLQIVAPSAQPPDGEAGCMRSSMTGTGSWRSSVVTNCGSSAATATTAPRCFARRSTSWVVAGLPALVLDGEIAVPDERGVTHIDGLSEAPHQHRAEQLAYFAFDLLHLDGHDLCACALEDRKALLRDVVGAAGCSRVVPVDHITGNGQQLFEAARQIGAESIVSKRAGSAYRSGPSRDWLKVKVSETGAFGITGYIEGEAVAVAELRDDVLVRADW